MAVQVVTLEIECHDEDNAFHTTYKVQKYIEYRAKLSTAFKRKLNDEGINHIQVVCNQGPPKGYEPIESVKNWYVHRRKDATAPPKRVRYPRLGSFEVTLKCPSDFAPRESNCPNRLQVWSKLSTKRWPDVDRLAAELARLLSDASQNEDVSDQVRRFQDSMKPPEVDATLSAVDCMRLSVNKSRLTGNSPMFFSMTPRTREPTPVEIRTPSIKSSARWQSSMSVERVLPQRPTSASTPSRAQRPSSAVRKRPQTASATLSSSNQTAWGAQEAPSPVQQTSSPFSQGHERKWEETLLPADDDAALEAPSGAVPAAGSGTGYQAPIAAAWSPAPVVAPTPAPVPVPAKLPALAAAPRAPAVALAPAPTPAAPVAPLQSGVHDDYDESFEEDSPTAARAALSSQPSAVSLEAEHAREAEARRIDTERLEAERRDADRHEAERRETERRETERRETERREGERREGERRETERRETERLDVERRRNEDQQRIDEKRRQDEEQIKKVAEREEQQRLEALQRAEAEAQRLEAEIAALPAPEVDEDGYGDDDSFEDDAEPPPPPKAPATHSAPPEHAKPANDNARSAGTRASPTPDNKVQVSDDDLMDEEVYEDDDFEEEPTKPELAKASLKPANDSARSAGTRASDQVSDDDVMDEEVYEDDDFEEEPGDIDMTTSQVPAKPAAKLIPRVLADDVEYDYVEDNEIEDDISEGSQMEVFEDDNISIQSGD